MGGKIREPSTFASVLLSLTMLCSGLLLLSPGTRAERLKATNTYHRPVMEARSPKRRCRGGHAPSGPWGGTCPASSSPLGVAGILSRGVWPLPPSPQTIPIGFPPGPSSLPLKDTSRLGLGRPSAPHLLPTIHKAPFLTKVTFTGRRGCHLSRGGNTI